MRKENAVIWIKMICAISISMLLSACVVQLPTVPAAPKVQPAEAQPTLAAEAAVPQPARVITSTRCGDPTKLSAQLNFYNYADYIDPVILEQFEQECGVKVVMDLYTSMEEALATISANPTGHDVYILTDFSVKVAIERDYLLPLDMSLIPNAANLSELYMKMFYDPKNRFSLPYQWGTTGVAYNSAAWPNGLEESWSVLFDPEQLCNIKGKATMLDNEREAPGAALVYLGYPWASTDPEAHVAVRELMIKQKECLAGYDSLTNFTRLASGELVATEMWSYGAAYAYLQNPNIRYFIPKEGGLLWQDNMVILKDSPNQYTAHVFINYLLDPKIGAEISEFTYTFTPNQAAEALLSPEHQEVIEAVGLLVKREQLNRLQLNERKNEDAIFSETWSMIRAQ